MDSSLWFKRMELVEVKSLIWTKKGELYIIYENVLWILGILRFKSIHLLFYTFLHMYISNDGKVILKYFHFILLVVLF
jgi:predicted membrane-bound dolichyl-phosphate-mannose-protein mannosyltransferase